MTPKSAKEEVVLTVFTMRNQGKTLQEIADVIGKTKEYVRLILKGSALNKATKRLNLKVDLKSYNLNKIGVSEDTIKIILGMINDGYTEEELKEALEFTQKDINRIFSSANQEFFLAYYEFDNIEAYRKLRKNSRQFTEFEIITIFELFNSGVVQTELAKQYNCEQTTISAILNNLLYKDVIKKFNLEKRQTTYNFTENDIINIFKLRNEGKSQIEIAHIYNVKSSTTICQIFDGTLIGANSIIEKHKLKVRNDITRNNDKRIFNKENIIEIYRMKNEDNVTLAEIAEVMNTTDGTISNILNAKSYKDIIKKYDLKVVKTKRVPYKPRKSPNAIDNRRKLTDEQIIRVFQLRNELRLSVMKIAKILNIGSTSVEKILKGQRYKDVIDKHDLRTLR